MPSLFGYLQFRGWLFSLSLSLPAHYSFAIFDFDMQTPFEGMVDTMKFRNLKIEILLMVMAVSSGKRG